LVKPISERDEWTVKLKRGLERKVLKIYFKKEGIK
jgi:predicted HAD superfamily phosphohydrolase YqeG